MTTLNRDNTGWRPRQSIAEREAVLLAPYAMHSAQSRGRKHPEPPHPYRGPFQRDRDRIVHSAAYRRLGHKTQVFTGEMGDYHRSRLTHTLEVSSIARTIGRALRLNEDLIEALALAHDIGHPPFGHSGEAQLAACLAADGGFNHNRHALRILEHLETRYHDFPGLNLTLEVLEGQTARIDKSTSPAASLLEVQVVDAADSIAYDAHDADDALELGLLDLGALVETSLWREAVARVHARHADQIPAITYHAVRSCDSADDELRRAVVHELIDWQVGDLLVEASRRIDDQGIDSTEAVRRAAPIVVASRELAEQKRELEQFLHQRVYRHPRVMAVRREVQDALAEMFAMYCAQPDRMPDGFRARIGEVGLRRSVGDYLAGMTDRFALAQHRQWTAAGAVPTEPRPELRP